MPLRDCTGASPVLSNMKQPVPQVDFAIPGSKQARPIKAACWSPASLSLQSLINLRRRTGNPVLPIEDGQYLGVCGENEIVSALAVRERVGAA